MSNGLVGCDPEFFVMDSSGTIIPGTVAFPTTVMTRWGYINHDGIAVEINPLPSKSGQEMYEKVNMLIDVIKNEYGLKPDFASVCIDVDRDIIQQAGEANPSALEFGCSPDLNAWGDEPSYRGDASGITRRYSGGHFHLDTGAIYPQKLEQIRTLERTVGLIINSFCDQDKEQERRKFYGKSGCCRVTNYGFEWRVPSSAIFVDSKLPMVTDGIMRIVSGKTKVTKLLDDEAVKEVINTGQVVEDAWNFIA